MSTMNDILHGLGTGPQIHDWQHANKIFVGNNYGLSPKYSFLFHVAFELNPNLTRMSHQQQIEAGMLVKSVQIPKFSIDTKTLNSYNRPNIVQQKIKYDPISITFHDDSSDVIRDFWFDYMTHYYRDSDYNPEIYLAPHKYHAADTGVAKEFWGYQPSRYDTPGNGGTERILNRIRIYSLYQKKFSEYILVNPVITNFSHGQHTQGQNEFLENSMTITYESVLYDYGTVKTGENPTGFAELNYDKGPSPLTPQGGGTNSIFGPGGLTSAVSGVVTGLSSNSATGILAAGVTAARSYNKLNGQNLLGMAGNELKTIASSMIAGDTNTLNRLFLPSSNPAADQGQFVSSQEPPIET